MSDLDVVIPVHNEAESVEELVQRIDASLTNARVDYNIIFVDDYSTDNTVDKIREIASKISVNSEFAAYHSAKNSTEKVIYDASQKNSEPSNGSRVKLLRKKGKQGKAYSILEGVQVATAPYVAMIDGDLQYPPEAIPEMYRLAHNHGVVVANRKNNNSGLLRRVGSKLNMFLFGRFLLGFHCDTQSGLKVFKKEIAEHLKEEDVTPWTLDMPLLTVALELGHNIGNFDVNFSERKNGEPKVNFFKTALEIALSVLRLRFRKKRTYPILPKDGEAVVGAGVAYGGRRFITHTYLPHKFSALETFRQWQKGVLFTILGLALLGLFINPIYCGIFIIAILSFVYFADLLFSLYILLKSLHFPPEIKVSQEEMGKLNDKRFPIYSILCPLYKEANVLPHFIEAIDALDWPKDKLDVLLLLEEDDEETIKAANKLLRSKLPQHFEQSSKKFVHSSHSSPVYTGVSGSLNRLNLPDYYRVLVVPNSQPKTKPKACNFGLAHAKGEFVVVYDAEDKPNPDQLKKAYVSFNKLGSRVVCLQSKLNYYNTEQNLLTRLFTAEYSLWFDLILPGFQSIETTIPLGGTSNHFKTCALRYLDGWDSFNVTEDCDLGARLYKSGFNTAIIDSVTLEEANSRLLSWLRQRSRWIKGYLQTYLVHMRDPVDFYNKHGIHSLIFQLVTGARMIFILINPILWTATVSYFALNSLVGPGIEALYPTPIFYIAVTSLVFGNFIYLYHYMIGCAKRAHWDLLKYVFLVPFYWALTSVAAGMAIYQLLVKPHFWEKTQHGLHLEKPKHLLPEIKIAIDFDFGFDRGFAFRLLQALYEPIDFLLRNIYEFVGLFNGSYANNFSKDPKKLNILVFNWRDIKHVWSGGAEVYIHELAKRWVEAGHSVTFFCGWDGKTKREENVDGVQVIRRGGFYTVYPLAILYYFLKFRGKYDIVVDCENGIPFFTPLFAGVPSVLLIHHVHQEVFRKHLRFPLSTLAQFLESKLMPALYIDKPVVTVSNSSKLDIVKRGWNGQREVEIVTPGVNPELFNNNKISPKTAFPSFVYLGRLKAYKNIDIAIQAFSNIHKKYPDAKFAVAGFGERLNHLKALAKKLGLEGAVEFCGRVSDEKRTKLFSESWAAIQPSSMEGWGITVIEANTCGTPVIASDVKGLRDSVIDGKTGILFPAKDVSKLTCAMEEMIVNTPLRQRLSEEAYLWSERFNWRPAASKFEAILYKYATRKKLLKGAYEFPNLQFEEVK